MGDDAQTNRIRQRAYELWEQNGRSGNPEDHWLQAERESGDAITTDVAAKAAPATRADAIGGPDPTAGAHAASPAAASPEGPTDIAEPAPKKRRRK